jgi:hypothetical protein
LVGEDDLLSDEEDNDEVLLVIENALRNGIDSHDEVSLVNEEVLRGAALLDGAFSSRQLTDHDGINRGGESDYEGASAGYRPQ